MKESRLQESLHAKTGVDAAAWQWARVRLGDHRWLRARLSLQGSMQPEAFLRLPQDWAFFWKSKEQKTWQAGWGAVEHLSLDQMLVEQLDPDLTIFGGFPFATESQEPSEWHEFDSEHWFVPKFIWRQLGGDQAELDVYCVEPSASMEAAVQTCLIEEAWDFYQKLLVCSQNPGLPLPSYQDKQEFPDRRRWADMIEDAQQRMRLQLFGKVVLSRRIVVKFRRSLPAADLFRCIFSLNEESFVFACQTPTGPCFMGRSPERLLAWQQNEFQVDAIAGTRGRSSSFPGDQAFAADMQQSPKEQNEHRLVGQAITDMLKLEGIPFERIDEEQIIRLQHVQHMRSRFKGLMPAGRLSAELLELLHPTPAVGGFPRAPALAFLLQNEGYNRGWFSGGIGMFHGSEGDIAIGIRSALLDRNRLYIYAGAGIVPGSIADAEWQEIEVKMQNFLGFLQVEVKNPSKEARASDALSL